MFASLTKARRLGLPLDIKLNLSDKNTLSISLYECKIWWQKTTLIEMLRTRFMLICQTQKMQLPTLSFLDLKFGQVVEILSC